MPLIHESPERGGFVRALIGVAVAALTLVGAACGGTTTPSATSTSSATTSTSATSTTSTTGSTGSTTTTTPAPPGGVIPANFQPTSFTAVSLDEWWMLGTARCLTGSGTCGAIVRTTNGGSSFAGIPSPPVGASGVTQLRFANARDGYAFDPELWATTNGGTSWVRVATPGTVTELEAADGETYALACSPGSATCRSMELLRSSVGSLSWQQVSTPTPLAYRSQFAVSGPDLYVLAGNGPPLVLLYSSDKGAAFNKRVDPCTAELGGNLTAAADGSPTLWAACPTGTEATVELSSNGGTTWREAEPIEAGFPNSLRLAGASSSVALAWPGGQGSMDLPAALVRTTNGGKSYSAVLSRSWRVSWAGYSDPVRAYALVTETSGTSSIHLLESNNGGATWSQVVIKS